MTWAVVVPSNRPERLEHFWQAWGELFREHDAKLYVVRDEPPWPGIPDFIPKRTDMIRSYGFYLAWRDGHQFTLSLDDDVTPSGDLFAAYEQGFEAGYPLTPYFDVGSLTDSDLHMRGFPYAGRHAEVAVQYGGWNGSLDLDAPTQLTAATGCGKFAACAVPVPRGVAATCCAMNFAFRTELTPMMWQLPLYEGRYNRFGDIWAGLIQKRVCDHEGRVMLVNGKASVRHERASDPFVNIVREAPGLGPNEDLWAALPEGDFHRVTTAAAEFFRQRDPEYADSFTEDRDAWLNLFTT